MIGINSAIASRSGAYNGIGFSIPSNDAKYIMESLIKNGKVVRGYLGVGIADVRTSKAEVQALISYIRLISDPPYQASGTVYAQK